MISSPQYYIGIMSGTSLDGIDTVLVDFSDKKIHFIDGQTTPYKLSTKQSIEQLINNSKSSLSLLSETDRNIALQYSDCVTELVKRNNLTADDIIAIGSHGQTLRHSPNSAPSYTLQIGDPSTIAAKTHITTVADFRKKDIALDGQGAPFAPAFHNFAFHSKDKSRVILNIGGIANITLLDKTQHSEALSGFDTGPGNTLMDHYCQQFLNLNYDPNGEIASSGSFDKELINSIINTDPYFSLKPPKSTGTDYFNLTWLSQYVDIHSFNKHDALAILCELSAQSIAQAINQLPLNIDEIYFCGGGSHNQYLIKRISQLCSPPLYSSEKLEVHPDWVEAIAFAWLARNTLSKKATHLKSITSATRNSIIGGIYYA